MESDDEGEYSDGDIDLDERLKLPRGLSSTLTEEQKKDLLTFKRSHNKVQYEERLTELQEDAQKKQDLAALKRLGGGEKTAAAAAATKKASAKKAAVVAAKATAAKATKASDDEYDDYIGSDSDADSLDNLFSDDVINKMSNMTKALSGSSDDDDGDDDDDEEDGYKNKKKGGAKKPAVGKNTKSASKKKTGKRKSYGSSEEEEEEERDDEEEDSDDDELRDSDSDGGYAKKKAGTSRKTNLQKSKVSRGKSESKKSSSRDYDDASDDDEEEEEGAVASDDSDAARGQNRKTSMMKVPPADLDPALVSQPAELIDYQQLCLRRRHLANLIYEPYFKNLVVGYFVRYTIGVHPKTNENIYRLAEICDVDMNAKAYKLNELRQNIGVRFTIQIGKKRHPQAIRIDKISNSRISESELAIYKSILREQRIQEENFLSKAEAKALKERMKSTVTSHKYTNDQIDEMLEKKGGGDISNRYTVSGALERLKKQLQVARDAKEWDTVESLQKDIKKLEAKKKGFSEKYAEMAAKTDEINRRAKEKNRLKDQNATEVKKEKAQGKVANTVLNPYLKRETVAQNIWYTGKEDKNATVKKDEKKKDDVKKDANDLIAEKKKNRMQKLLNATLKYIAFDTAPSDMLVDGSSNQARHEVSIDKVRVSVMKKLDLDVDPIEYAGRSKRQRYLESVASALESCGRSRDQLRRGMSMEDYIKKYNIPEE